ncbi:MAG: helix-turn-helix domain-containing protein [Candidatus Odinarchaeota archaeon]
MPKALALLKWDNVMGAVLDTRVPANYNVNDEEIMRIYMSHTIGNAEAHPVLTMKLGELNVASKFVKLANGEQLVVVFFLKEDEPADKFTRILDEVSDGIINRRGTEGFEDYLKDLLETVEAQIRLEEEIPRKILAEYGLSREETEAYLAMVDKGPISIGEIGLYANVQETQASGIADRLLKLGLLKSIPGTRRYFQAIPPYTALLKQLGDFREFLGSIHSAVPTVLAEQFQLFEEEVNNVKSKISKAFEDQLKMKVFKTFIENMVQNIVGKELDQLKNLFQERVIEALKDIITNIDGHISVSEDTMSALWKRAKSTITFKFTDVWFVTGREGFKAQISDMLSRAKTRILIVTPELKDLEPSYFANLKEWVNVRISTNMNPNNGEDKKIYEELTKNPNISIKLYSRKDLWAMDKDREEILIGAVAEQGTPVGIASIVPEHIRMFMPIIEQAWVEARKLI